MGNLDSANVVIGKTVGALAWIKAVSQTVLIICIVPCNVLAEKIVSLKNVLKETVKIINFVKNWFGFSMLCD